MEKNTVSVTKAEWGLCATMTFKYQHGKAAF